MTLSTSSTSDAIEKTTSRHLAVVATAYGGPEVLSVVDVEVPPPGPGEVTIEVRAAGVNPVDSKFFSGTGPFGNSPDNLPMRVGLEVAGLITAVGAGAVGPAGPLSVGDAVIAYPASGGYATAITVSANVVVPKPAELSWEQAAGMLLVGATALHAVAVINVGQGDTALVHGRTAVNRCRSDGGGDCQRAKPEARTRCWGRRVDLWTGPTRSRETSRSDGH
jgi:NADPH2:quinone reductase